MVDGLIQGLCLGLALIEQESAGDEKAVSPAGAIGLTQLMPETAKELGVDPWDPSQNVRGGFRYLIQQLIRFGSLELAVAAYNAGPGRISRLLAAEKATTWEEIKHRAPRETQAYVRLVKMRMSRLERNEKRK